MNTYTLSSDAKELTRVVAIATLLVAAVLMLQVRLGLNIADEGFLWYGTIRTAHGEVPLRDFQAYDPGRYYWGALWMHLFGEGIIAHRCANALFSIIGLTCGLLVVRRVNRSWILTFVFGIVLALWLVPRHKLFEPTIALTAVYLGLGLLEDPSLRRYLVSGVFAGLLTFFGRNHALYVTAGFCGIVVFLLFKQRAAVSWSRVAAGIAGVATGLLPMIVMFVVAPRFWAAYLATFTTIFENKVTNLARPVPWPWTINYHALPWLWRIGSFLTGSIFLLAPLFLIVIILVMLFRRGIEQRLKPLLACALIGLPYLHHAFARADLYHLAQAIHPTLLSVVVILSLFTSRLLTQSVAVAGLFLVTLFTAGLHAPAAEYALSKERWVRCAIRDDTLLVPERLANFMNAVTQLGKTIPQHEGVLAAPHCPIIYPVLGRKSPLWDIYLFFPADEAKQQQMIAALETQNVRWAILGDDALDGRDETRMRFTHPLLWNYITTEFTPQTVPHFPPNYKLWRR